MCHGNKARLAAKETVFNRADIERRPLSLSGQLQVREASVEPKTQTVYSLVVLVEASAHRRLGLSSKL